MGLLACSLFAGCATHSGVEEAYILQNIEKLNAKHQQEFKNMELPIKLAVANVGTSSFSGEFFERLEDSGNLVSDVITLPSVLSFGATQKGSEFESGFEGSALQALLKNARKQGAEYLFVVEDSYSQNTGSSIMELLDIAILPAFVVPSRKIDMKMQSVGFLLSVSTGEPVFGLHSKLSAKKYSAGSFKTSNEIEMALHNKKRFDEQVADDLTSKLRLFGEKTI